MSRNVTVQWIRDQARQIADEPEIGTNGADGFITNATATEWVNQAIAKLRDMMVSANPDWLVVKYPIHTTAGTQEYDLPDNFYQARGVDMFEGPVSNSGEDLQDQINAMETQTYYPIESFNFLDRGRDQGSSVPVWWRGHVTQIRYRIIQSDLNYDANITTFGEYDEKIRFEPDPGTRTYRLWYVPAAAQFETDGTDDANNVNGFNGFEEYIIGDVAEKMMGKAETDPSVAVRMKREATDRIAEMARKRDQGRPVQVADTRNRHRHWRHF